jgi:cytochrome c oxidase subunit II
VKKFWCLFFMFWPIVALVVCAMAPGMNWWFPGESNSPIGVEIDGLFNLILIIVTIVFIGTQIAFGYVLWKGAHIQKSEKALYTHGSHNLEIIWTILPCVVMLFIALYQMEVWAKFRVQSTFDQDAVSQPIAEVTARQFEWRIRYPGPDTKFEGKADITDWLKNPRPTDLYTVNDLHVPAGKNVLIHLRSGDVQHSFFVPELRIKQDAVPGTVIPIWFNVDNKTKKYDESIKGFSYELVCAELCGWGHYKMKARVVAQLEDEYKNYLLQLQKEQFDDGVSAESDDDEEEE